MLARALQSSIYINSRTAKTVNNKLNIIHLCRKAPIAYLLNIFFSISIEFIWKYPPPPPLPTLRGWPLHFRSRFVRWKNGNDSILDTYFNEYSILAIDPLLYGSNHSAKPTTVADDQIDLFWTIFNSHITAVCGRAISLVRSAPLMCGKTAIVAP